MFFVFWELCARSFAFWCSFVELCPTHHARPRASLRLTCCECLAAPPTPWLHCVVPCTPQACCMVLCFVGRVTGWQRDAPCAAGADAQGARVRLACCRAALALTMCHDWGACCGQQAGVHAPALCMPFEQHDCFAPYDKNPFIACKCTACLPAFFIGGAARPVCVRALEPKRRVAYTTAQHESLSERKSWFNESLSPTQLKGTLDHSSLNTNCGASCFAPTPASPPAPLVPPSNSTRACTLASAVPCCCSASACVPQVPPPQQPAAHARALLLLVRRDTAANAATDAEFEPGRDGCAPRVSERALHHDTAS